MGPGDAEALDRLVPLVHDELRDIAGRFMNRERRDHTLQPTALVNEVFLRLIEINRIEWQNRSHFFAMAARLMRRVLVDWARAHNNEKRGGRLPHVTLDETLGMAREVSRQMVTLDEALRLLHTEQPRKADVVELRYFGGLTIEKTAEALGVSVDTVKRDWRLAKLWLLRQLDR